MALPQDACLEARGTPDKRGYHHIWFGGKDCLAHRVAYCGSHGLALSAIVGLVVRHTCDNPPCLNPAHLLLGTHADNMQDMADRGRSPHGEAHCRAVLTAATVLAMRARYVPQCRVNGARAMAKEYGVNSMAVSKAVRGITWRHI